MVTYINSDSKISINKHFRITAGPGAGKTHWLIENINHLITTSNKLTKCSKVACVTYTNVGVETIKSRLRVSEDKVEISTLHSFFYNNIVSPYLNFVAEEEGFNIELLKGEDDRYDLSYNTLSEIKKEVKRSWLNDDRLKFAIKRARWKIDNTKQLVCEPDYPIKDGKYVLPKLIYQCYKRKAWKEGLMHYDDVIYFSYRIITKFPFLQKVIAARFPYIFIDEFQDSNPIQVAIIEMIGQQGALIGVIGDPAQSIYKFLGADASQFTSFTLPKISDYCIKDNRRSTKCIVNLLNLIRKDLQQISIRNIDGEKPVVIVGDVLACYKKAIEIAKGEVYALAYSNIEANRLKTMTKKKPTDNNLIDNISDSNLERCEMVSTYIKAVEHAKQGNFKHAIGLLDKIGIGEDDANKDLHFLLSAYDRLMEASLYDFYLILRDELSWNIAKMKKDSRIKTFYDAHGYKELALCVNHVDDDGIQRTVHKSKGDEFDNVMLCLSTEDKLNVFFKPQLKIEEAHRVYYVALSRARERIFVAVPILSNTYKARLKKMGFKVEVLS